MDKKTRQRLQQQRQNFCSLRTVSELCLLLKTDKRKLQLLASQPPYKTFTIPKKNGGERLIEAPNHDLKRVLSLLNRYLQSTYYFEKSRAAYGFIVGVKNDDDRRNVLANAKKHLHKTWLLNIDLKDFFHSVDREQVVDIFVKPPFKFKRQLPDILADLTTYNGRLPMGTPTSPVLSNFACRILDERLSAMAEDLLWVYTRYADDMSFSSNKRLDEETINSILRLIREEGFSPNKQKIKLFGPKEDKIVTGLLVSDKVSLAPDYLPRLENDIRQLAEVVKAQNEQGQLATRWVEQLKQQVRGRLSFAGFVLKRNNEQYMQLRDAYYLAVNPPQEDFGATSWRGFPYNM
jgi:RNA-directed DNA polymerase